MSKQIARVVFAVLISLAVVLVIYTSVQGASLHAGTSSGQAHLNAGLLPDTSHVRSTGQAAQSLAPYYPSSAQFNGGGHGCERDAQSSPDD